MEEDIEDIIGQIKYTDSQKSVVTSNSYSQDFTDSSSDRNQSSGKETYIIDNSDNEKIYPIHSDDSILNSGEAIEENRNSKSFFVENTFTQTSRSIFELKNEVSIQNTVELQHFETQTSFVTIIERVNENVLIVKDNRENINKETQCNKDNERNIKTSCSNSDDNSSKRESEDCKNFEDENILTLKDYESKDVSSECYGTEGSTESWDNSDIEEDSLMRNDCHNKEYSSDIDSDTLDGENDVAGLHNTLATIPKADSAFKDSAIGDVSVLTTVTEETNVNSILDVSQGFYSANNNFKDHNRIARSKFRIQALFNTNESNFKLPPITNTCPNSPMINPLFSVPNQAQIHVPSMARGQQVITDLFKYGYKNPASGESTYNHVSELKHDVEHILPPISFNTFANMSKRDETKLTNTEQRDHEFEEISINERIQDLKVSNIRTKAEVKRRNRSPGEWPEQKVCEVAERSCDALCCDLMRRLQSSAWQEVAETLAYLPKSLESFWTVMSEIRIADLLRQIISLVESPRTQVARAACEAAARLLKHTNFTKKPDFSEAVGVLLAKTNSYNRPVRRAANLALDELVCGLPPAPCLAAICGAGVEHKSPLVRCAASRLLIVGCALAEGGRRLLRCRPPAAAAARRTVLRAMAALLQDRNLETRKYAERLYGILRPLPNFEAYFLSDVDAELATEQMKKYDQTLTRA